MARYFLRLGDREVEAEVDERPEGVRVGVGGRSHEAALQRLGWTPRYGLILDGRPLDVLATETAQGYRIVLGGATYDVDVGQRRPFRAQPRSREAAELVEDDKWVLLAPMTGVVVEIRVTMGAVIEEGAVLMIIEAMKMQNELNSRHAGVVSAIHVSEGDPVQIGQPLVEISAPPENEAATAG